MDRWALAIKLRLLRDRLKMSQMDFGQFLGVDEGLVAEYESGIQMPTLDFLYTLAEKCGVSLDWACGREMGYENLSLMRSVEDAGAYYRAFQGIKSG